MSTVGIELEWADVDRWSQIPSCLGSWNTEDYTIVNSDGHANHPTGATWRWGGEINTVPTDSAAEQADIVGKLAAQLNPTINYRCNLHVHVKPTINLLENIELLKLVAERMRNAEAFVYSTVEPIPKPTIYEYPDADAFKGAMKRYRRRLVSHHYSMPLNRWNEMMSAPSVDDFYDAHAAPTTSGKRAWHLSPRAGMNFRSLRKHGTIEFRHFPGTADPEEIESAASWCLAFVDTVFEGARHARDMYRDREWKFPKFKMYEHNLETIYQATKFK